MSFISDDPANKPDAAQDPNKADQGVSTGAGGGGLFGSAPSTSAGGATATGGNAANGGAAQQSNSAPGQWANLNDYFSANQDQSQKLATDISGKLGSEADQAKSSLDSAKNDFTSQVDKNTVKGDPSLFNSVGTDPNAIANDSGKLQSFQKDLNANYAGPKNITDESGFTNVVKSFGQANTDINRSKTEEGRQGLLSDQYKRPDYTSGQQNFDQMLLSRAPNADQAFGAVNDKWSGISGALGQAQTDSSKYATDAAAQTAAAHQGAYQSLYGDGTANNLGAIGGEKSYLDKAAADLQAKRMSEYTGLNSDLASRQLNADDMTNTGLAAGQKTYGLDLTKYLQNNVGTVNKNNVATDSDVNKLKALSTLSGDNSLASYVTPQALSSPATSFDAARFQRDAANQQTAYAQAMKENTMSMDLGGGLNYQTVDSILHRSNGTGINGDVGMYGGINDTNRNWAGNQIQELNALRQKFGLGNYTIGSNKDADGYYSLDSAQDQAINSGAGIQVPGIMNAIGNGGKSF